MSKTFPQPTRILVVEDERIVARALRTQLTQLGYEIVGCVPTGLEAIEQSRDAQPDLVLMDIRLEGEIDGIEAGAEIRSQFGVPVVYLTSYSSMDILDRAKITGPAGYVLKPYEERELQVVIETAVFRSKMEHESLKAIKLEHDRAIKAKDLLLATMSHEFRTPLNAVIGYAGIMLMGMSGPLTPLQEEQLQTIERTAQELLKMLTDLLDLAKLKAGKVELNLDPAILPSVMDATLRKLLPLPEEDHAHSGAPADLPHAVSPSDTRVATNVMLQLVSSAIRFAEEGTVRLELDQRHESGRMLTEIRVIDTGVGIIPDEQAAVFDEFKQMDAADRCRQQSTGLGLYLMIRRLAALMGARIAIRSETGKGSTLALSWTDD